MGCGSVTNAGCMPPERVLFVAQEWPHGCSPSHGYYVSIQAAITAANALVPPPSGANPVVIYIAPGHYEESLTLSPWVYLKAWGQEGSGNLYHSVTVGTFNVTTCTYTSDTAADVEQIQLEGIAFNCHIMMFDTSAKTAGSFTAILNGCFANDLFIIGNPALVHCTELDDTLVHGSAQISDMTLKMRNHSVIECLIGGEPQLIGVLNAGRLEADRTCQLAAVNLTHSASILAYGVLFTGPITGSNSGDISISWAFILGDFESGNGIVYSGTGHVYGANATVIGSVKNDQGEEGTGQILMPGAHISGLVRNQGMGVVNINGAECGDINNSSTFDGISFTAREAVTGAVINSTIMNCQSAVINSSVDNSGYMNCEGVTVSGTFTNSGVVVGNGAEYGSFVNNAEDTKDTTYLRNSTFAGQTGLSNTSSGTLNACGAQAIGAIVKSGSGDLYIDGADFDSLTGTSSGIIYARDATCHNNVSVTGGDLIGNGMKVGGNVSCCTEASQLKNAVIQGNLTNADGAGVETIFAQGARVGGVVTNNSDGDGSVINITKGTWGSLAGSYAIDRDQDGTNVIAGIAGGVGGFGGKVETISIPSGVPFASMLRVLMTLEVLKDGEDDHACDVVVGKILNVDPTTNVSFDVSVLVEMGVTLTSGVYVHWSVMPCGSPAQTTSVGTCPLQE